VDHRNTNIAFSPSVIAGATLNLIPVKDVTISLLSKYVGRQYLDNTESDTRKLDPYYTQDIRLLFTMRNKIFREWNIVAQVSNLFDIKYEPNGYTYGYLYDGKLSADNYYFPMAGTNFMLSVNLKL